MCVKRLFLAKFKHITYNITGYLYLRVGRPDTYPLSFTPDGGQEPPSEQEQPNAAYIMRLPEAVAILNKIPESINEFTPVLLVMSLSSHYI